jgi:hypothetical protein
LEIPGKKKAGLEADHLDNGYWHGTPVGGFGAGSFSRSYRGDFVPWHIKGGVHKYETVPGNLDDGGCQRNRRQSKGDSCNDKLCGLRSHHRMWASEDP